MRIIRCHFYLVALLLLLLVPAAARAQSESDAWLRYAPLDAAARAQYRYLPQAVVTLGDSEVIHSAQQELIRGIRGMLGTSLHTESQIPVGGAFVLGIRTDVNKAVALPRDLQAAKDGYILLTLRSNGFPAVVVTSQNDRGVLYGVFAFLRLIALGKPIDQIREAQRPSAPIRWVNQWDNLNGTIERGYGGSSIFFEDGHVRGDLSLAGQFARLLASLGINGCAINNVNADPRILASDFIPQLARVAAAFRPWGVQLAISVDFASPKSTGGLDTFDPLDPRVSAWWNAKVSEIYRAIPDFAGFVLKADSEDRSGPSAYGRTQAEGANSIARALRPHGGILFYRAFVYNHHLDWRDLKADRARAAYDIFHPLDGQFDSNVILQIKNGPIDFQVREPASPLFSGLEKTNEAIELQITQEYTGQARHLCFLVPMWKATLDFDMHAGRDGTSVKALVEGKVFQQPLGGFVGVSNVGSDSNWLGNDLSLANLYGFGRLAWNPDLSAQEIAEEWTRLTFGSNPRVVDTIVSMQLSSWRTYENYTGPLGAGTLTAINGNHYGPAVESSERNGWGQWHRADANGIGMDRTVTTGTGFIGQYWPAVAKQFESLADCPDALLLFFHHVPYTYRLHSGQTVIQYIYDSHYEGAAKVEEYVRQWKSLHGLVGEPVYSETLRLLEYQAGAAQVWRDAICNWFLRTSGIPDEKGRAGNFPGRTEAEAMKLEGYVVVAVTPWETASGGKAIACPENLPECSASFRFQGSLETYDIDVEYFDTNNGAAKFKVFIGGKIVDEWFANDNLPTTKIDGSSSTRRRIPNVNLTPGEEILIEGLPNGGDRAALDYVGIHPQENGSIR
jgi:alpha-glucuronidase